jgi:PKD domain-containing protein
MRVRCLFLGALAAALICCSAGERVAAAAEKAAGKAGDKALAADLLLLKLLILTEADPDSGPAPLTVQFKADVYEGDDPVKPKYIWSFGDGTQSREQNPKHVYKKPGTYQVGVNVTDGERRGSDTLQIDVEKPEDQ